MDIITIMNQMSVLFIVLAVGYVCKKIKLMSTEAEVVLSRLLLGIVLPCTILSSVMSGNIDTTGGETAYFMLMIILTFLVAFIIGFPVSRIMSVNMRDRGLLANMIIFANVGFMGFPVTLSIFGSESAFYVALFNIPFNILAFSVGIIMISGDKGKISPKTLLNPCLIAALLAVIIVLTRFNPPAIISGAAKLIGGITTPAAMLIIGSTLASVRLRVVFLEWRIYLFSLIKLVVIPFFTWLALHRLISDTYLLGILVVLSGMPTAITASILSMQYGANKDLASKTVFITTLMSVVTIPIIAMLLLT